MEPQTLDTMYSILIGFIIFMARVIDVSIGTMRTISIVHGKVKTAFLFGLMEVSIWLVVITTVLNQIKKHPYLGIFYAVGFATGNVVGILIEKNLPFGNIVVRLIDIRNGSSLAQRLRLNGYHATLFKGESNPRIREDLSLICKRRDLKKIIGLAEEIEASVIYTSEQAGVLVRKRQPVMQLLTGWRAIFKKK